MEILIAFFLIAVTWTIIKSGFRRKPKHKRKDGRKEPRLSATNDQGFKESSSEKVRSTKDISRIQALPNVEVECVIDGDTVDVFNDTHIIRIRLDSIDCPEDDQDWGVTATKGLVKLIGGKSVQLETHGTDPYGRTLGTLFVYSDEKEEWLNVNERMVTLGHAWVMRLFYRHLPKQRREKLNDLERWAKSKKVGLWKTENPIPPWEWRKM